MYCDHAVSTVLFRINDERARTGKEFIQTYNQTTGLKCTAILLPQPLNAGIAEVSHHAWLVYQLQFLFNGVYMVGGGSVYTRVSLPLRVRGMGSPGTGIIGS